MDFDEVVNRRGTRSRQWDDIDKLFGIPVDKGLGMWTADMDFRAPDFLQAAIREQMEIAHYGYFTGLDSYRASVAWWMAERHGWQVEPEWMFTTGGLGNGIALALQALTEPGDHIVTFNPVYHEFEVKIRKTGRVPTQLPLSRVDGVYQMDFEAYDSMLTGREKMVIFCSPHNPAGRVWTQEELTALADFCIRHDLLLIADEIHHDLVMPSFHHLPTHAAIPQIEDRLIMMTAASKTFNIAGQRTGCVSIPNAKLRKRFADYYNTFDISPNMFGIQLTRAAYSPDGAKWVDALNQYIDGNQRLFNDAMNGIPGVSAMPMQATYLAWIDFAGTGMEMSEVRQRVFEDAKIAATWGPNLGPGGETFIRFTLGTSRTVIGQAIERLQIAFTDLQ